MMNGREKSDSAIVSMNPTNDAGRPGSEPGERRAETEGNVGGDAVRRTPSRSSASRGLDRVRRTLARSPLRRQTPKVGAVCGKAVRTVLCGGRAVMRVPTAIFAPRDDGA